MIYKVLPILLSLYISATACGAADQFIYIEDGLGRRAVPVVTRDARHKEPFSVRHPKLFRKWRRFRRICVVIGPTIPVLQLGAQICGAVNR